MGWFGPDPVYVTLKPCPLCRSKDRAVFSYDSLGVKSLTCPFCRFTVRGTHDQRETADKWNSTPNPKGPQ